MALLRGMTPQATSTIHRKLVDSLYVEAMLLADEARAYFDVLGRAERDSLEALSRVTFSCESLKVTTRLMHIIAWLLTQRAVEAGELTPGDALSPSRRLGDAPETDAETLENMPAQARAIIATSIELHRRVSRLDASLDEPVGDESPARRMLDRLSASF
jgi:regulator of CtrA degradation